MVFYQPEGSKDARQLVELEISPLYCHISRKKPWDAGDGLVIIFRLQTRHAQVLHTRLFVCLWLSRAVAEFVDAGLSRDAAHSSFLRRALRSSFLTYTANLEYSVRTAIVS
jgi:hypothetical protein